MITIVEMLFGSHLYGTDTPKSDKDYKGVFMPSMEQLLLQRVPHSLNTNSKKGTDKNLPTDVDSEFYSLNYFIHLACQGETVALDMLHAPEKFYITSTGIWDDLVKQRSKFYTKSLKAFVGYARRQAAKYGVKGSRLAEARYVLDYLRLQSVHARLADVWDDLPRGEHIHFSENTVDKLYEVCGKKMTSRGYCFHYIPMMEAFVERYGDRAKQAEGNEGVDWKAVSHAFRAAYQVKHILVNGGYTYPLPETDYIKRVKSGTLHFSREVGPALDTLMEELEALTLTSTLPEKVDRDYWDDWLVDVFSREYISYIMEHGKSINSISLRTSVPHVIHDSSVSDG